MELSFKGLETLKSNTPTDRAQRVKEKKWGYLSRSHVYYWSYDH